MIAYASFITVMIIIIIVVVVVVVVVVVFKTFCILNFTQLFCIYQSLENRVKSYESNQSEVKALAFRIAELSSLKSHANLSNQCIHYINQTYFILFCSILYFYIYDYLSIKFFFF